MGQAIADITRIVNTSILQQLPDAYFQATGLATGIHNVGGELITTIPKENFCSFCRNMFFSREGHRRCVRSNSFGERRALHLPLSRQPGGRVRADHRQRQPRRVG